MGRDACSIASVLCKGASASLYVTLCTDNQRSCLFSEHCLALTAVSRRYTRSTATWQHRAPCKLPVICATADARIHSLALCRAFGERGADLACSRAFGIVYMETHIKTFVGTHICVLLRRVLGRGTSRPPGALCAAPSFRGRSVRSSASGGSLPAPSLVVVAVVVMAAPASLSPEELLPKGGAGKAEDLEDELEDDDDDEEVARRRGGPGWPGGPCERGDPVGRCRPDGALSPAAGRDAGGAAVGADRDVPRERALGGRSHLRPVAGDSAEDVQVRGGEARELRRAAEGSASRRPRGGRVVPAGLRGGGGGEGTREGSECCSGVPPRFVFLTRFAPRRFSRAALWIGTTSFMILVLPVVFETEKLQMEQQQQLQQRQVRLELRRPLSVLFGCGSGCLRSPTVISWRCGSGSRKQRRCV